MKGIMVENDLLLMNLNYSDKDIIEKRRLQKCIKRLIDIVIAVPLFIIVTPFIIIAYISDFLLILHV